MIRPLSVFQNFFEAIFKFYNSENNHFYSVIDYCLKITNIFPIHSSIQLFDLVEEEVISLKDERNLIR